MGNDSTALLCPLWCAEYEHEEVDKDRKIIVKARSYTPWLYNQEDIVDFVAEREGSIKKVYRRLDGDIEVATAQGAMQLKDVLEAPDITALKQPNPGVWSYEDLALG